MAMPPSNHPFPFGAGKLPRGVEPVFIADADHLAQAVDSPASESGPLFRVMFPRPGHAEGIKDAIIGGRTYLRKIRHGDGTFVGNEQKSEHWLPGALDVPAWLRVSAALRKERQRAIGHLDNVCRITFMSICSEYQRQGLGSMLMQHICEDMDPGVGLYSKFGFEAVGQVDTPYEKAVVVGTWGTGIDTRRPRPSVGLMVWLQ
ncbi:hypothetical protein P885DRAFT_70216 [Corynascus similis CBS 632.67]